MECKDRRKALEDVAREYCKELRDKFTQDLQALLEETWKIIEAQQRRIFLLEHEEAKRRGQ